MRQKNLTQYTECIEYRQESVPTFFRILFLTDSGKIILISISQNFRSKIHKFNTNIYSTVDEFEKKRKNSEHFHA